MNKTIIGWTDYTSNPIRARNIETGAEGHYCEKISAGCQNCYASEWNEHKYGTSLAFDVRNRPKVEMYLNERELAEWQKAKYAGKRVFVCDMTDMFGEWVPDDWLDRIFAVMGQARHVTFQILTKRPGRMREFIVRRCQENAEGARFWSLFEGVAYIPTWPLSSVWLGVSVEDQEQADKRIPILLDTPAAVHFVSYEPALEAVDFSRWLPDNIADAPEFDCPSTHLTWLIAGAESGPHRRPFEVEWAKAAYEQCKAADVAFWMKQSSAYRSEQQGDIPDDLWAVKEWPA